MDQMSAVTCTAPRVPVDSIFTVSVGLSIWCYQQLFDSIKAS